MLCFFHHLIVQTIRGLFSREVLPLLSNHHQKDYRGFQVEALLHHLQIIEHIYFNLPFTELIAEYFPGGWVHVGIIKGREKEKVLKLKDDKNNYRKLTIEELKELYA